MRRLLWLYPAAWRRRYGGELEAMLGELPATPSVALDLIVGAGRERLRVVCRLVEEGPVRLEPAARHPTAWALVALAVIAPTVVLVLASLLAHELGIAAVAAVADPLAEAAGRIGIVELFLVGAPLLGLLVALAPVVELTAPSVTADGLATVRVRLRGLNITVAAVALALGLVLIWHHLAESMVAIGG
jgi:hypothetical protein